jgi:alpha-acetolactate decarboxylase
VKKRISLVLAVSAFLLIWLFGSAGCKSPSEASACIPDADTGYILIFNCVDELLAGDLTDTVPLKDLERQYSGEDIVGLGTTSRQHSGELLFISGKCYWADPTNDGKITEIGWTSERMPFCAITRLADEDKVVINGISGYIHESLAKKMVELNIPLAAVKIEGRFNNVDLSIADRLPARPNETLKSTLLTVSEEREWQMVGFYALMIDDQAIISVPESAVHLHGKTLDNSHGGHIKRANSVSAIVTIYPIKQYILRNMVPGVSAVTERDAK